MGEIFNNGSSTRGSKAVAGIGTASVTHNMAIRMASHATRVPASLNPANGGQSQSARKVIAASNKPIRRCHASDEEEL